MKSTPWTCLEGSTLWDAAADQYRANGHAYHNMDHVCRLYMHAADMSLPYDPVLDRAILAHDVIIDGAGDHEIRSADWLDAQLEEPDPAARRLIETTITHEINPDLVRDRRLVLLDLADFKHKWQRRTNTRLLRDEADRSAAWQGEMFDQAAWVYNTLSYLQGLQARITTGMQKLPEGREQQQWREISRGIAVTMATMPYDYAPHPAECIQRYTRSMEDILRFIAAKQSASEEDILGLADATDFWSAGQPTISDTRKLTNSLERLRAEGLVRMHKTNGVTSWEASETGLDWIARMDAPHTEWPEPAPSV